MLLGTLQTLRMMISHPSCISCSKPVHGSGHVSKAQWLHNSNLQRRERHLLPSLKVLFLITRIFGKSLPTALCLQKREEHMPNLKKLCPWQSKALTTRTSNQSPLVPMVLNLCQNPSICHTMTWIQVLNLLEISQPQREGSQVRYDPE